MKTGNDRMDLVDHFSKEKKPYTGPKPFSGIGIADRPPAPSWRENLARYLARALSGRPSIRWGCAWSGAPVEELNRVINSLCEKGLILHQRHQTPGHAAFWTISRGLNFNPQTIEEEIANA